MLIKWYGQSCVVLESLSGLKILCDPYDKSIGYSLPTEEVDIITVSHNHFDHNAVGFVKGSPKVIRKTGEYYEDRININGIHTWHDSEMGRLRGNNISYRIEMDNISFVHLGDLGHVLEIHQVNALMPCDILFIPVGGIYTLDVDSAYEVVKQLKPQIVIPIHYHTPSNKTGIDSADNFIDKFLEVRNMKTVQVNRKNIPRHIAVYFLMAQGECKK